MSQTELEKRLAAVEATVNEMLPMVREMYQARAIPRPPMLASFSPRTLPPTHKRVAITTSGLISLLWALAWGIVQFLQH